MREDGRFVNCRLPQLANKTFRVSAARKVLLVRPADRPKGLTSPSTALSGRRLSVKEPDRGRSVVYDKKLTFIAMEMYSKLKETNSPGQPKKIPGEV